MRSEADLFILASIIMTHSFPTIFQYCYLKSRLHLIDVDTNDTSDLTVLHRHPGMIIMLVTVLLNAWPG